MIRVLLTLAAAFALTTPAQANYEIKGVLAVEGPMRPGDYYWDESGVPAGEIVITADLTAQTISVFRSGYEIGTAVITYGTDDKPTPTGVYPITQKRARHVSSLYGVPMPYMQRLTGDGISIHGADVAPNVGTHGCIGVPTAFAKLLFGVTKLGDRVIITDGEMLAAGGAITAR
ncbi:MAG: L,D-transpeptidase family protein [Pseudomonadota bacterium]